MPEIYRIPLKPGIIIKLTSGRESKPSISTDVMDIIINSLHERSAIPVKAGYHEEIPFGQGRRSRWQIDIYEKSGQVMEQHKPIRTFKEALGDFFRRRGTDINSYSRYDISRENPVVPIGELIEQVEHTIRGDRIKYSRRTEVIFFFKDDNPERSGEKPSLTPALRVK